MIREQSAVLDAGFVKQDKGLAQSAPAPAPTGSGAGSPHRTSKDGRRLGIDSFSRQISPALFAMLGDPVFGEHARLKGLLNKNERQILKAAGEGGMALAGGLLSLASWYARAYRESWPADGRLKPEAFMDLVVILAEVGAERVGAAL